ncbi:complex I 51 kDa subunit family protein [Thermorudis peleae]|uniref:complex I 51 kDa subunit family protein n=1 Tax=Thermorudis peleae TaxID=1382356 RepID=UPI000571508C|nr:NADH-ubiquinone oxidoreductase-F iron-sulfur binding region domain-containing protein [Thermorudis peleae]MBX6753418.1 NADH-quinone oxidoreductase subunit F [Thermorudis peleae]
MERLSSRQAFDEYVAREQARWESLWNGDQWVVSVGISECSIAKGAEETYRHLSLILAQEGIPHVLRRVGCAGWCFAEPYVEVRVPGAPPIVYAQITTERVPELVHALRQGNLKPEWALGVRGEQGFDGIPPLHAHPFLAKQRRLLFADAGVIDPESISDYIARGGYQALRKALFEMTPEEVVAEVKAANLRGRGGAGFPAGIKWESGRRTQAWPKYVVVNSHEGEFNVYKDRRLLESNPHLVLEGLIIGCYALETPYGYNYIGGEHALALKRFQHAVEEAYALGLLGDNILGTGFSCHVRVRTGGGAYICGEGSALMYAIMGYRGQPRTKPPRSVEEGLWKRPTVLNNTETFANVPGIIRNGGKWYASIGPENSPGTKLVTMQGPLVRLGVAEIEMGLSLRELIFDVYGGMREGYRFKGIQMGGVSSGPLREDELDVGVDFDSLDKAGVMLGSGGFVVFDDRICAVDFARFLVAFSRYESCAKCNPCRLGNPALLEILDRIRYGEGRPEDIDLIKETSKHIIELSLCGLGQVAPMPALGMLRAFPEEFEAHIREKRCPAGVCPIGEPAELAAASAD